jgi:signal transduction histidine kinase
MDLYRISLPSVGPLVISIVALLVCLLQGMLYLAARRNAWTFWGAVMSAGTAVYAFVTFVQYNTGPEPMTRLCSQVQLSTLMVIILGVLEYAHSYLRLGNRRAMAAAYTGAAVMILLICATDLVFSHRIERIDFLWLRAAYYQPAFGPLGPALIACALATAAMVIVVWIRHLKAAAFAHPIFIAGILWLLLGIEDASSSLHVGYTPPMPMVEYGFLGFSLAILSVTVRDYLGLFRLAESRQRRLLAAKLEAEKANRAKSLFLAKMSHELRTPLNHVIGFTELVSSGQLGEVNPTQQEYLEDSLRSSRHLLSLISDILDLAKAEAGRITLEKSAVDLARIVRESAGIVRTDAAARGIAVTVSLDEPLPAVAADGRRVTQVLVNLLSNAIKFSPDGGTVEVTTKSVAPLESNDGTWLVTTVRDKGIGLLAADLDRIFRPFEQVEDARKRGNPGTGLGLPLSREIVSAHGGRLWASSDGPGKGATFTFTIPVRG